MRKISLFLFVGLFSMVMFSCEEEVEVQANEKDCKCGIVYGVSVNTDGIGNKIYRIKANNVCSGNAKVFQVTQADYYKYYEGDEVCSSASW